MNRENKEKRRKKSFRYYFEYIFLYVSFVVLLFLIHFFLIYPLKNPTIDDLVVPLLAAAALAITTGKIIALERERDRIYFELLEYKESIKRVKERYKNMIEKSNYDPLTRALNRRAFNEILGYKIMEAKQFKHPLSMIMFDIDHFKKINDIYGHQVGDKVLAEISNLVRSHIRQNEIFVRWGGEEFVILASGAPLYGAVKIAEKLHLLINEHKFEKAGRVTCSFGVTDLRPGDSIDSFVKRADEALYTAKENGRNRIEVAK
ncbi:GGDEF domain-containing protein [Nitrosophilus alvini]|uniref:GGDEF domain-containing protein n=1 Tax=Nitrosophilus alvini TaxID=2714855 RepID=UPI001F1AB141|nr:GGDEF domain-containing protein [Nitrosophilus alvini]